LRKVEIKAAIPAAKVAKATELSITRDKMLKELAAIGLARLGVAFGVGGHVRLQGEAEEC